MIGTEWCPSIIENTLYDIMEKHEIGIEFYKKEVIDEISEYFSRKTDIQWQLGCSEWPDMTGGTCYVSFLDGDTLHMVGFDYSNNSL